MILHILAVISSGFSQNNNTLDSSSDLKVLEERINSNAKLIEKLDNENTENKHDLENKLDGTKWIVGVIIALAAIGIPVVQYILKEKVISKLEKTLSHRMNRKINLIVKEKIDPRIDELERLLEGARLKHSEIENISVRSHKLYSTIKDNPTLSPENKKNVELLEKELKENKVEGDYTFEDWFLRGINSFYDKEFEKAVYYFTKAIELKPDYYQAYYNRGFSFDMLKEYDKAIKDQTRAIELNPQGAEAYYLRGRAFDRSKEYGKAIGDYTRAIEIKPDTPNAYNDRGYCHKALKDYGNAIKDFIEAAKIDGKSFDPQLGLAISFYEMDNKQKAKEHLQAAKRIEPKLETGMNSINELEDVVIYNDQEKDVLKKMFAELK